LPALLTLRPLIVSLGRAHIDSLMQAVV
jgi:hypothetical protein